MNTDSEGQPEGGLRTIGVDLPPGLVGNPGAMLSCSRAEFDSGASCPASSQVGLVEATVVGLGTVLLPLYSLTPPPGYVASFGGAVEGNSFVELLSVHGSGPGAHLHVSVPLLPMGSDIVHVAQTLWGVPADPGHDAERGECLENGGTCPAGIEPKALLTLPVHCGGSPVTTVTVTSAEDLTRRLTAKAEFLDQGGDPQGLVGCDALSFSPALGLHPEGAALSSSGLQLDLSLPASEQPYGRSAASLRELTLDLPPGLAINPAAAAGLEGCGASAPVCPGASKIGTASADLPALGEVLSGSAYLATPDQNPYGTRFAVYLVLQDPSRGLAIKVPGRFEADPATGQLTVAFTDLPEFPFAGVSIRFPSGPRALFATPPSCGTYATAADLVPSSSPEGATAHVQSHFTLSSGPGGACPPPEPERPVAPAFEAGTTLPIAGSSSSFVLRLSREDLDQHLGSFDLTLPPGLIADLGSVPVGTGVGSVRVEAGLDPQPLALEGTAYLGGPYKGAPYSLEFVVPAQAGPFDLGTIRQRAAVEVDPVTAQVSVHSDPLPQILAGVPLELRSLTVDLDRPGFVRNPTSCEPMAIAGSATSSLGRVAPLSTRFQVGACAALPFQPRLGLRVSGALGRNGHPALRAVLRTDPAGASLASVAFALPAGELLDLRHVRGLCPRELTADRCPSGSRLGKIRLQSSFLDGAVEGPVYLREPRRGLPDLSAEVRSGALRFLLHGHTSARNGRLAVSFGSLPDIPLSQAVLSLPGGRRGIVVNSRSLCSRPGAVSATASAHNGLFRRFHTRPRLDGSC